MPNNYKFTSPIRYFKANDPYYYEVDNIPLRQLEENVLHLKSKIETTVTGAGSNKGTINLSDIKDLKAYHKEGRTVAINPGKFIARVNTLNKARSKIFSNIQTVTGQYIENIAASVYTDVFNSVIGTLGASPLGFNGLEFLNGFYIHSNGGSMQIGATSPDGIPQYSGVTSVPQYSNKVGFPILKGHGISNLIGTTINPLDKMDLLEINRNFVQQWGGIFRTALVSVDEELTLEIPVIGDNELFVQEIDGTSVNHSVSQRIDLLVLYTVPVDATEATIVDYSETAVVPSTGTPASIVPVAKKILTPQIGIVRGAGIGLRKSSPNSNDITPFIVDTVVAPGKPKILPALADKGDNIIAQDRLAGLKIGNTTVRGSFPSPDDLLNLAPALVSNALEFYPNQTDQRFIPNIGQTVLPIAYIVVNKTDSALSQTNIVDIRPFFRTTELTYNERAGIAAASPPLSFANPVASKWDVNNAIANIQPQNQMVRLSKPLTVFRYHTKRGTSLHQPLVLSGVLSNYYSTQQFKDKINVGGLFNVPLSYLNSASIPPESSIPNNAKALVFDSIMCVETGHQGVWQESGFAIMLSNGSTAGSNTLNDINRNMQVGCAGASWVAGKESIGFACNTTTVPLMGSNGFFFGVGYWNTSVGSTSNDDFMSIFAIDEDENVLFAQNLPDSNGAIADVTFLSTTIVSWLKIVGYYI